jgi:hypothetical protein
VASKRSAAKLVLRLHEITDNLVELLTTRKHTEFQDLLLAITALGRPHRRTSSRPHARKPIR